jgi:hypothetical protein
MSSDTSEGLLFFAFLINCQQFSNAFLRVRCVDEIEIAALASAW